MHMKCFKVFAVVLLIFSSSYAQDCKARVVIITDYVNSLIMVNDSLKGMGKADIELSPGTYIISLDENSDRYNSKSFKDTVEIKDCKEKKLEYNFRSELLLRTEPDDAYVYSGDSLIGHTPLFLPTGLSKVKLTKPGYENNEVDLSSYKGNEKINLKFTGKEVQESFFKSTMFKVLLGGITALGAVTAYFKIKADNRFDEYQLTGNKEMLDKTHTYDLISGISFAALQINFGLLIYYFLND